MDPEFLDKEHERMTELYDMVKEIDEFAEGLSKWEINFIAYCIDSGKLSFTLGEEGKIREIYEKYIRVRR
jgi:hypothetical protein